jgi:mannose/fructose/N-acetylgalactosamine-specific phosphotransferase system component IID
MPNYSLKQTDMKKNMGSGDKIFRFIVAAIFAALYFTNTVTGTWGIVLLVLAVVFVLTSFISFCPLYVPFGISTCKTKSE